MFFVAFAVESDNTDSVQFECAFRDCCTDSKNGFMMEEEERKCCKSGDWTDMNSSGTPASGSTLLETSTSIYSIVFS